MIHRLFLAVILVIILAAGNCDAQPEFKTYPNGLIYSDTTMDKLRLIVDSMNIKYRHCDLWKDYYSVPQTTGYYITLDSTWNVEQARKDIMNGISYEDFIYRYPRAKARPGLVIEEKRDDKSEMRKYYEVLVCYYDFVDGNEFSDKYAGGNCDGGGKWLYRYSKSENEPASIEALFMKAEASSMKISEQYARMIQYSECMIDTNTEIFVVDKQSTRWNWECSYTTPSLPALKALDSFINRKTKRPLKTEKWSDNYYRWYNSKDSLVYKILSGNRQFIKLLKAAVGEGIAKQESNEELENYAAKYYSKEKALYLMRCRVVVGMCSQDDAPRGHAKDIALLSAETAKWDIFLRAHMDMINDNFTRFAENSATKAERETHVRELELLDIDVTDLLLGIGLRFDKPARNHYFGSSMRIGKALAELENSQLAEEKLKQMMLDDQLDNYNRMAAYFLYSNLAYNIPDKTRGAQAVIRLKSITKQLPEVLQQYVYFYKD